MLAENLKYLRKKNQVSQQGLADELSIPRSTLGDYERGKTEPNINLLIKLSRYFDYPVDAMISEKLHYEDYQIEASDKMKVLAISVDQYQNENIELVDTKAEAGYLDSYQDPEYIKDLPKIHFPSIPKGVYRGFEINGDSMLPIESGSIIICSYVESLNEVKDDKTYVVVSKREGLVYKRVKRDALNNQLILQSDNDQYLPYIIEYEEIDELWQYYAHLSFSDSKASFYSMLEDKLDDIQRKVTDLHQKHR